MLYSPMPVRQDLQETKDAPSERGKALPLAGGESLVEQAEDGSGQQNDERPNHALDHPLKNINPGSLGVNPGYGRRGLAGVSRFGALGLGPGGGPSDSSQRFQGYVSGSPRFVFLKG